jgi:hypothetical protein
MERVNSLKGRTDTINKMKVPEPPNSSRGFPIKNSNNNKRLFYAGN